MMTNARKSFKVGGALLLALGLMFNTSCDKEEPSGGTAPTQADAAFTYQESAANPNVIEFKASSTQFSAQWDLGNGDPLVDGAEVTGTYPKAGTYTVTLTVFNASGSASSSQEIVIAQDDISLLDKPLFNFLTGGVNGPGSKTWAIDSASDGHFGVGPNPPSAAGEFPEWYAATGCEKAGGGMYDDRYTFSLQGFGFDMITNGNVFINTQQQGNFTNTVSAVGDFRADYANRTGESWTITEGADTTLTISGDAFIGYYTGVRTYKVLSISENEIILSYDDDADAALRWYIRLVPVGVVTGTCGGGGSTGPNPVSLPLDFEGGAGSVQFEAFGGNVVNIIANPDMSGINTSGNVVEAVHGSEVWAGFFMNLNSALDFSSMTTLKLKVWAPVAGDFRVKLEEQANPNNSVELDAAVTTTNSWTEITFDFSASGSTAFDRLVLFPGWNVANAGTFYVDDISQQ